MGTFFENKVQHQHMSQWKVHPITLEHFQMDLAQQQVFWQLLEWVYHFEQSIIRHRFCQRDQYHPQSFYGTCDEVFCSELELSFDVASIQPRLIHLTSLAELIHQPLKKCPDLQFVPTSRHPHLLPLALRHHHRP